MERAIYKKHIRTISFDSLLSTFKNSGCKECQNSCQSACKTSCTVGNLSCENKTENIESKETIK